MEQKWRLGEEVKLEEGLASLWRNRRTIINEKIGMVERTAVFTVLYRSESWVLNARERRRGEVFDMRYLRIGI